MDDYDGYSDEDIDGLTIHDDLSFGDENDAAAQWLANQMMGDPSIDGQIEPESPNEAYGGATASTLQLQRISHVEPRIQAGIRHVLEGGSLDGSHPVDLAAAREEFGSVIEGDIKAFARQIKVDEAVSLPRHEQDIRTVMSMIGNTAGAYMERGPGGQMVNTHADADRAYKADEDFAQAVGYVKELADLYIDPRTVGTSVEGARRQALEESITKRLIDGTFYQGSKDTLPLPNETGVTGIRPTQGIYGTAQGTAFDRLSASKFDDLYETYPDGQKIKFRRNDQGGKIFKAGVSQAEQNEALRNTPSLANSLFPKPRRIKDKTYSQAELDKQRRDQSYLMSQAQGKADFARKVLRQQMPTTRDESKGQMRMTGWDTPTGEHADDYNLRNEAAILGLEWDAGQDISGGGGEAADPIQLAVWTRAGAARAARNNAKNRFNYSFDEDYVQVGEGQWRPSEIRAFEILNKEVAHYNSTADSRYTEGAGQGSERGGMYGERQLSEVDLYTEQVKEDTLSRSGQSGSPAQGTQAWLNQRKGKITASTAAGLLKEGGVEERALELAMERLGTNEKFLGNAHTREGNDGEEKARRAFMSGPGRGLVYQEAFFEENEAYQGFGVSPDGRLYDDEGNSKGLLELKYLSSGSMAGALNKYTPQMQMQMAVTGETETHFYALDKYTGEYVHERVQADPEMQAQLIKAGTAALEMGAELDNRGVRDLRKQIQSAAKPRKKLSLKRETGQQSAFVAEDAVEEVMTPFNPREEAVKRITSETGQVASDTAFAKKLEQDDQRERMKEALNSAMPETEMGIDPVQNQREQAKARNAFVDAQRPNGGMSDDERGEMSAFYRQQEQEAKQAANERKEAQKETTQNLKEFGEALKGAAGVAGELAGLVLGGLNTGMSEVRAGAEAGMSAAQSRGAREALELGSLSDQGAISTISRAGQLQATFNDQVQGARQFTEFMQDRGTSGNAAVRGLSLPSSPQEFASMTPQQLMRKVASDVQAAGTPEDKQAIANFYGMPEMAVFDGDPSMLSGEDGSINEVQLRDTNRQYQEVMQLKREVLEEGAESINGGVLAAAGVVAGVAGSKTVAATGSKASKFMSNAAKSSPRIASAVKSASTLAKATPMAIAASAAPMAIRAVGDIKDDGSVGDSAMDVLEFAAYGAAAGSIVPGVGTAVGAGVGAAIGVANEAWEWWNADDAVPEANIGPMPTQTREQQSKEKVTNVNVEVMNEISQDLIRTTTDIDGEISVDEDNSLSTGGY